MSARLEELPVFRPMRMQDVDAVMALEREVYPFPWTRGNFTDSLKSGYSCWVYEFGDFLVGYAIMMLAAGEAHLLNLAIAKDWQAKGMGRRFTQHLIKLARDYHADIMFLEVRPSNTAALHLYHSIGFNEMAVRKRYYPAHDGREDAILMGLSL